MGLSFSSPLPLRRADPGRDNAALCALARRCPQGRRLRFYHERADYRERGRLQAEAQVWVVERGETLVGAASLACKPLWLDGAWQRTAYLFDLMVDPDHRRQGLARHLLRALRQAGSPAQVYYSYLLEDNTASRQLFEGEGFTAHRRRLLYHTLLPRLAQREPPPGFHWCEPVDPATAAAVDALLRPRYTFVDTTAGQEGVFRLDWRGTRAWAVLRRLGPQVLVRVPWYAAVLARLLPFLPRPGRPVHAWSLHHLAADGPEPGAALSCLVRCIAWVAAREGIDALVLPLFEDDPQAANLRRLTWTGWGLAVAKTRLYVAGDRSAQVLAATQPLLMSGRDG